MNSRESNDKKREAVAPNNPLLVKEMKGEGVIIRNVHYNIKRMFDNQRLYYNHVARNGPILDDTKKLLELLICKVDVS